MEEHLVYETTTPRWINTLLTTLGALLTGSLLLWVANSQLNIVTTQAVIKSELENLTELIEISTETTTDNQSRLEFNQNQIWPRLRAHGQNIELVHREVEKLCNCKIELIQPEKF